MNLVHWYSMHLPSRNFLYQFYCIQYTVCVSLHHDFHPSGIEISRSTSTSQHLDAHKYPAIVRPLTSSLATSPLQAPLEFVGGSATLSQPQGTSMGPQQLLLWEIHEMEKLFFRWGLSTDFLVGGQGGGIPGYQWIFQICDRSTLHYQVNQIC